MPDPDPEARRQAVEAVVSTPEFTELVRSRNRFSVPAAALSFAAYLVVIILSGFTPVLAGKAFGQVSWTFLLTVLIFPMVWVVQGVYGRLATRWDELGARAIAASGVETHATRPTPEAAR
jgi:uncharacterized membrane protein (DUF485 family)